MGRPETARAAISADWQLERADYLRTASGRGAGEFDWDRTDRAAASDDGGLYFAGDGEAGSGVVDVAGPGAAVRDCVGERAADTDCRAGDVDVEGKEDPHSGWGAVKDTALCTVLFAAEGCGPVLGGVR